jgi:hypothetical protein
MGSIKVPKPQKKKAKFLKPGGIPETTLDSDREDSENDNSEK